jgi:hypothetical protein
LPWMPERRLGLETLAVGRHRTPRSRLKGPSPKDLWIGS